MKPSTNVLLAAFFTALAPLSLVLLVWTIQDARDTSVFGELIMALSAVTLVPIAVVSGVSAIMLLRQYVKLPEHSIIKYFLLVAAMLIVIPLIRHFTLSILSMNDPERDAPLTMEMITARKEINDYYSENGHLPIRNALSIRSNDQIEYSPESSNPNTYKMCANFHVDTRRFYGELPVGFSDEAIITDRSDQEGIFYIHNKNRQCYRLAVTEN